MDGSSSLGCLKTLALPDAVGTAQVQPLAYLALKLEWVPCKGMAAVSCRVICSKSKLDFAFPAHFWLHHLFMQIINAFIAESTMNLSSKDTEAGAC